MTKFYPESKTPFSIKLPLSILFEELANFTFAVFMRSGAIRCRAPFWTRHAVDRSVVLEMVRWTSLAFSAWTVPKLLKVALLCKKKMLNSNWANKTSKKMQEDMTAIWRTDPKIQIILNPDPCSSDSSQGLQLHSPLRCKKGWVWLPAGCWWDQSLSPKSVLEMQKPSLYADIWPPKQHQNSLEWECVRIYVGMCKVTWWCIREGEQVYLLDLFALWNGKKAVPQDQSRIWGILKRAQPTTNYLQKTSKKVPTSWREASKSALAINHCPWNCWLDHVLLEKLFSVLCKQKMQKWHDITTENKTFTQQHTKMWQSSCWSKLTFCRSRNTPSFIALCRTPCEKVMSEFPLRINDLHLGGTASTCVNLFNAKSKATKEDAVALPSRWPVRPELTAWRLPKEVQCWKDLRSSETSLLMGHLVRSKLVNFGIQLCFSPVSSRGGLNLTLLRAKFNSWSSWQHPFQLPSGWPATPVPDRSTDWISFQLNMVEMSPETLVPDMSKCFNLVLLCKRVMSPEALHEARLSFSKSSSSPKRSSSAPFTSLLRLPKSISVTWQFLLGDMGKSLSSKKFRGVAARQFYCFP